MSTATSTTTNKTTNIAIKDQTIWIVGASSGIGRSLALQLAEAGNFVIISGRREDSLKEVAEHFPKRISALTMDASDVGDGSDLRDKLQAITDAIDIVIMAAGTVEYEDSLELDVNMYKRVFDGNFFSMVNTLAIAKPFLEAAQQRAYIVGISSLSMMIGFPRAEAYGASKAAADYFLHSLSLDLPQRKYDVSIVRPGFVETPMTSTNDFPMPFLLSAEEAATRIIRGMEKRKRLIVFPKRLYFIIKFLSWFPTLWYRYLGPKTSRT